MLYHANAVVYCKILIKMYKPSAKKYGKFSFKI